MVTKKHIYGRRPVPPNTFIGGVADNLSTKSLLAAKLGIAPTRIKSFRIVNDEVQAYIDGSYIISSYFLDNPDITHYRDEFGLVTNLNSNAFRNCSKLTHLVFLNSNLSIAGSPNDNSGVFRNCPKLTSINAPFIRMMTGRNHFADLPLLTEMTFNYLEGAIETGTFKNSRIQNLSLPLLTTVNQEAFGSPSSVSQAIQSCSIPNLTTIGFRGFENFKSIKELEFPNFVYNDQKTGLFTGCSNLELISMKKLKYLGDPSSDGSTVSLPNAKTFNGVKLGCKIMINVELLTANLGMADQSLLWAKANRNAVVEFYDDDGNYVSTL